MTRVQRLKIAEGYMIAASAIARLQSENAELRAALELVINSGPLNNGLTDANTMAIARAAIAKAKGEK